MLCSRQIFSFCVWYYTLEGIIQVCVVEVYLPSCIYMVQSFVPYKPAYLMTIVQSKLARPSFISTAHTAPRI